MIAANLHTFAATFAEIADKNAEQSAASAAMMAELRSANNEVEALRLENRSLRERLEIIESGGMPPKM